MSLTRLVLNYTSEVIKASREQQWKQAGQEYQIVSGRVFPVQIVMRSHTSWFVKKKKKQNTNKQIKKEQN